MRLRGAQAGLEGAVDEKAPDLLVGDRPHELLDVDAPVAQRTAVAIGFGDLRGKGDDTFETRLDFAHVDHLRSPVTSRKPYANALPVRSRPP